MKTDKLAGTLRRAIGAGMLIILAGAMPVLPTAAAPGAGADPLRIVVVGATSKTANELIPQALWRGYEVVALARRPYRVRHAGHPRLTIRKGDVYDEASIAAALSGDGQEVVVSIYGPRVDPTVEIPETDLMSRGTSNIIRAMKSKGNRRLFVTSSTSVQAVAKLGYTAETPRPPGLTPERGLWFYNMRGPYNDMLNMEKIALGSGLEATVLRPGQLLIQPANGDILLTVDTETPNRRVITYADFAAFILDQVESPRYVGHIVGIYSATEIRFGDNGNIDFEASSRMLERERKQAEADLAADPEAYHGSTGRPSQPAAD